MAYIVSIHKSLASARNPGNVVEVCVQEGKVDGLVNNQSDCHRDKFLVCITVRFSPT